MIFEEEKMSFDLFCNKTKVASKKQKEKDEKCFVSGSTNENVATYCGL